MITKQLFHINTKIKVALITILCIILAVLIFTLNKQSAEMVINNTAFPIKQIDSMKESLINPLQPTKDLFFIKNIQGNSKFSSIEFAYNSGGFNTNSRYFIYNKKTNKPLNIVNESGTEIAPKDIILTKYLSKGDFVLLDTKGYLYKLDTRSGNTANLIKKTNIKREELGESVVFKNNLYINTRTNTNNFNENEFSNNKLHIINLAKNKVEDVVKELDSQLFISFFIKENDIYSFECDTIDIDITKIKDGLTAIDKKELALYPKIDDKILIPNKNEVFIRNLTTLKKDKVDFTAATPNNTIDRIAAMQNINVSTIENIPILENSTHIFYLKQSIVEKLNRTNTEYTLLKKNKSTLDSEEVLKGVKNINISNDGIISVETKEQIYEDLFK